MSYEALIISDWFQEHNNYFHLLYLILVSRAELDVLLMIWN